MINFNIIDLQSSDEILDIIDSELTEDQIYEISVRCAKRRTLIHKKNLVKITKFQQIKQIYKVKKPQQNKLKINMYCYSCETNYDLVILSDDAEKGRKLMKIGFYMVLILLCNYLSGYIWSVMRQWTILLLFAYILKKISNVLSSGFVMATKNHRSKVLRKYQPISVS